MTIGAYGLIAISSFHRDISRMVVIPFNLPKIGAHSENDCRFFQELGLLKKESSACVGWAISLRAKLKAFGVDHINTNLLPKVHTKLLGVVEPRVITGCSILLFFIDEVSYND